MTASTLIGTYISQGTSASLPTTITIGSGVSAVQYETDTHGVRFWNGSSFDRYTFASGSGTGTVTSVVAGAGLAGGTITTSGTVSLAGISAGNIVANTTTATAAPTGVTVTSLLDDVFSNARGSLLYRGASAWAALAPSTSGQFLQTTGTTGDPAWATLDSTINTRPTPTVVSAGSLSLSLASHNNHIVVLNSGASLTVDWNNTGAGFSCVVVNNTTSDILPTVSNFTATTVTNPGSFTKIKANGMVSLIAYTPDSGTTKVLRASGDLD